MTAHQKCTWLVAGLLLCTSTTWARGQTLDYVNTPEHDLQFFSPTELDFDFRPMRKDSGYYFRYDKLNWAFTGEHVEIGDPDLVVQSEVIFYDTPDSIGTPPATFQINNSIQEAPPDAAFAWGERYELGLFNNGAGWTVGILDGPEAVSTALYGFQELVVPNTIPFTDTAADIPFADGFTATLLNSFGLPATGSDDLSTSRAGFGSVHVNFATPAGYLLGFRDYYLNAAGNPQGPTTGGPGRRVATLTLGTDVNGNPVITDITITSGSDGVADDLNGNTLNGFFVVVDAMNNIIANGVDFEDLHMFNIRFDTFEVRNTTETQGIEIMRDFKLSNNHKMAKHQGQQATIGVGARYLRLRDSFFWEGRGDVFGRTFADTKSQNSIVGPQIRAQYSVQRGRWNWALDGRFLFGYNINDLDQVGAIGEDLVPGALNRPASAQPHAVSYGRQENFFSPVAEMRAECSYQFTSSIALRLGYTATFVDNITRASQTVNWFLPDLGIRDNAGQQDIFINGADFGFDVIY